MKSVHAKVSLQNDLISEPPTRPTASHENQNPFVKIGDRVKLHSRSGTYRVLDIQPDHFTAIDITSHWFSRKAKDITCSWDEFKGWSRKVEN